MERSSKIQSELTEISKVVANVPFTNVFTIPENYFEELDLKTEDIVTRAKNVINLDNINETFLVEGESQLETKNHTTLQMKEDCLITCQTVYNPFKNAFVKSKD